jgi:hypothetical protein
LFSEGSGSGEQSSRTQQGALDKLATMTIRAKHFHGPSIAAPTLQEDYKRRKNRILKTTPIVIGNPLTKTTLSSRRFCPFSAAIVGAGL